MKYKKKPIIIEAIQYNPGTLNPIVEIEKIIQWMDSLMENASKKYLIYDPDKDKFFIRTLEGDMFLSEGDYIICGINKEFYPCKLAIFEKTYEEIK